MSVNPLPSMAPLAAQRRVLDVVRRHPGLSQDDITRRTGLSRTVVIVALRALRQRGEVTVGQPVDDARLRRYYLAGRVA